MRFATANRSTQQPRHCLQSSAGDLHASPVATSLTNFHYVARKHLGTANASSAVGDLLHLFDILEVNRAVLVAALARAWPDFEDAVQDAAAELAGVPTIVTRDAAGYIGSTRRIVDATSLVAELEAAP